MAELPLKGGEEAHQTDREGKVFQEKKTASTKFGEHGTYREALLFFLKGRK